MMDTNSPSISFPWAPKGRSLPLILGPVAAVLATLFVLVHWSVAVFGAVMILVLSAVGSEPFILTVVFLLPVGWLLKTDFVVHDVMTAGRVLIAVGFFVGRLWRGQFGIEWLLRPALSRWSLAFGGATLLSATLGTAGWTHHSARAVILLASWLSFYFVMLTWANSRERIRKVLTVLLCSTIVASAFGVLQKFVGGYTSLWLYLYPPDENFVEWIGRVTSFLNYPNTLAGYLNLILPFALACLVLGRGTWKVLGGWTAGLGLVALLCTQSLGGLVSFGCVAVLAVLCFATEWKNKLLLVAGICAVVVGYYLAFETLNPVHEGTGFAYDQAGRFVLWGVAWNLFVHSPIIGVGWGNFVELYGSYVDSLSSWLPPGVYAVHNIYLQLLAETGLVGFFFFFSLIFHALGQAFRQMRSSADALDRALAFGVLGAILATLSHGFVDFLFEVGPQFGTLFWMLLALLSVSASLEARERAGGGVRAVATLTPDVR